MPMSVAGGPDIPVAQLMGPKPSDLSYVVRSGLGSAAVLPRVHGKRSTRWMRSSRCPG